MLGVLFQLRTTAAGDWRFLYLSPGIDTLFEIASAEACADGRLITRCIVEADWVALRAVLDSAAFTLAPLRHDFRIWTKSGQLKWVRVQALADRQASGELLWNGLFIDITEARQVEAALLTNQRQLRDLIDFLPDATLAVDRDKRVIIWNRAIEQMTGVPAAEMLGKGDHACTVPFYGEARPHLLDLVFIDDAEVTRRYPRIRREGNSLTAEVFCNALHGNRGAWVLAKATPLYDPAGEIVGAIEIIRDITERKEAEQTLRTAYELQTALLEQAPVLVWRAGLDAKCDWFNSTWLAFTGRTMQQEIGDGWTEGVHPEDLPGCVSLYLEAFQARRAFAMEYRLRHRDGGWRWIIDNGIPIRAGDGVFSGYVGYCMDITDRKRAERQLQESEERHRLFFEQSRDAMMTLTPPTWRFASGNAAACQMYGVKDEAEFVTLGPWDLSPEYQPEGRPSAEKAREAIETAVREGSHFFEWMHRRLDGVAFPTTVLLTRMTMGGQVFLQAIVRDITALKENERRLEQIAHYDALTTLPNRVLLADRLRQGMAQTQRRNRQLAVAYLDLDGFKAINDRHGHAIGDQLLMAVADRMRQTLRQGDTLARLGGDEFVAVLLDLDDPEASQPLLARLLAAAAEPVAIGDLALKVSASVGVTFYPQPEAVDGDQLLRQADQAMYQSKLAGRNRFHCFDVEHDRNARGHHESLENIRAALAANQFVLHYQPKVNLRTGRVIGAEALIRWQHPERGLLAPGAFLPVIENHPLAIPLGEWVIDTALAQMARWRADGLALPVSVNIGARQLQQPNFVERLRAQLLAHPGVPARDLELELLETSVMEDLSHVSQVIADCGALGINCALDDFGTGYSSLTYLKRLPVAILKIDQSFVREMLHNTEELAIVESILGLAINFRRLVIAEGVETVAHGELLRLLGGELAQGYGIARPMPAAEIPRWTRTWRPDPRWVELTALSRDERPLVHASVDHRAWMVAIEQCLRGESDRPPPLDVRQCRFGCWLTAEEQAGRGVGAEWQALDRLHRRVHELAVELLELRERGQREEALGGLRELQRLRDDLLSLLEARVRGRNGRTQHPIR